MPISLRTSVPFNILIQYFYEVVITRPRSHGPEVVVAHPASPPGRAIAQFVALIPCSFTFYKAHRSVLEDQDSEYEIARR